MTDQPIKPAVLTRIDADNWACGEFRIRRKRYNCPCVTTTYYVKRGDFVDGTVLYKQSQNDFETLRDARGYIAEVIAGLWD